MSSIALPCMREIMGPRGPFSQGLRRKLSQKSAAASALERDNADVNGSPPENLSLLPLGPPTDAEGPSGLPLKYQAIITVSEAVRHYALRTLGKGWRRTLPRVPVPKEELRQQLGAQLERNELLTLRQFSTLGSESAEIIAGLEPTRELVRTALSILRVRRPAQVALITKLCGARFKHYVHGVLVLTRCARDRLGGRCGKPGFFDHLLR